MASLGAILYVLLLLSILFFGLDKNSYVVLYLVWLGVVLLLICGLGTTILYAIIVFLVYLLIRRGEWYVL